MSVALERALEPSAPSMRADLEVRLRQAAEGIAIPVLALLLSAVLFSLFLLVQGYSPLQFFTLMYTGGFGSSFSLQNSLQRATPLLLTALCVAIPARLGLVVIGGEGALVLGGLMAAAVAVPLLGLPAPMVWIAMGLAGALGGAICIGLVGALRHYRGVNETISSLLDRLHRDRDHEPAGRGPLARPGQPQQALDPADRRRLHAAGDARPRRPLGPRHRRRRLHRRLAADGPHHLRLRRPDHRRQSARGHAAGPARRQADDLGLRARRRLCRARRA